LLCFPFQTTDFASINDLQQYKGVRGSMTTFKMLPNMHKIAQNMQNRQILKVLQRAERETLNIPSQLAFSTQKIRENPKDSHL
jgi:hypothetical protein